jgi:tRNA pseudouridine55 synthase
MTCSGWIILHKQEGDSSAQAVAKVKHALRRITGEKIKIGHTGTLDPFATGVLPLAIGEATKLCDFLVADEKIYDFTMNWGAFRDTGDKTGVVTQICDKRFTCSQIESVLPQFTGTILQHPHRYSAIKQQGVRAYEMARQNIEFTLPARPITIYDLHILSHAGDETTLRVRCSKGTYVRVLAEDIAKAVQGAAYVSMLCRKKVGAFDLKDAVLLDKDDEILYKALMPIEQMLVGMLAIDINARQYQSLQYGQSFMWQADNLPVCEKFILTHMGKIVAIAIYELDEHQQGWIKPKRLIHN